MIKFCIKSWIFVSLIRKLHNKHAKSGYVCCGQQQNISFCNKTYMHCTVRNQCTHKCVNIHTPVLNSKIKKTNPMRSNFHYRWYHLFTHTHFVCTHNKTLLCFITEIQKKSFVVFFFVGDVYPLLLRANYCNDFWSDWNEVNLTLIITNPCTIIIIVVIPQNYFHPIKIKDNLTGQIISQ